MRLGVKHILAMMAVISLFHISLGTAAGRDSPQPEALISHAASPHEPTVEADERNTYTGIIRVYVTEMTGRWTDDWGGPFGMAFLAFALEDSISLGETDTLTWDLEWDGHDYFDESGTPFDDLQESNIKVIAAVFNSAGYPGYSDPPSGLEFTVHEVDACAGATCGSTGYNLVIDGFTHSVLAEDGTSTW